jgi:hypothetical protein
MPRASLGSRRHPDAIEDSVLRIRQRVDAIHDLALRFLRVGLIEARAWCAGKPALANATTSTPTANRSSLAVKRRRRANQDDCATDKTEPG